MIYEQGDIAVITATLTPSATPTASVWTLIPPQNGAAITKTTGTDPEATVPSVGVLQLRYPIPVAASSVGNWQVRIAGTGNAAGAAQGDFSVRRWP